MSAGDLAEGQKLRTGSSVIRCRTTRRQAQSARWLEGIPGRIAAFWTKADGRESTPRPERALHALCGPLQPLSIPPSIPPSTPRISSYRILFSLPRILLLLRRLAVQAHHSADGFPAPLLRFRDPFRCLSSRTVQPRVSNIVPVPERIGSAPSRSIPAPAAAYRVILRLILPIASSAVVPVNSQSAGFARCLPYQSPNT